MTPRPGAVRADLEEVFLSFSRSAVPAAEAPGWLAVAAGPPAAG